jgi:hypothetical protein
MSDYWFTDMSLLMENHDSLGELSTQAQTMSDFLGEIIRAMEGRTRAQRHDTGIPCPLRPGGRQCRGEISGVNLLDNPEQIFWECPVCKDQGKIFNFRGTIWDPQTRRQAKILQGDFHQHEIDPPAATQAQFTPRATRLWGRLTPEFRLLLLNNVFCTDCGGTVSMGLEKARVAKGNLILQGACLKCGGPVTRLVEI